MRRTLTALALTAALVGLGVSSIGCRMTSAGKEFTGVLAADFLNARHQDQLRARSQGSSSPQATYGPRTANQISITVINHATGKSQVINGIKPDDYQRIIDENLREQYPNGYTIVQTSGLSGCTGYTIRRDSWNN